MSRPVAVYSCRAIVGMYSRHSCVAPSLVSGFTSGSPLRIASATVPTHFITNASVIFGVQSSRYASGDPLSPVAPPLPTPPFMFPMAPPLLTPLLFPVLLVLLLVGTPPSLMLPLSLLLFAYLQ